MRLQRLLGILPSRHIVIALPGRRGGLEKLRTDPSLEDEPRSEIDATLLPVPLDGGGTERLRGSRRREVRIIGSGTGTPVFDLVKQTHCAVTVRAARESLIYTQ